jgi:hypothetical protein
MDVNTIRIISNLDMLTFCGAPFHVAAPILKNTSIVFRKNICCPHFFDLF